GHRRRALGAAAPLSLGDDALLDAGYGAALHHRRAVCRQRRLRHVRPADPPAAPCLGWPISPNPSVPSRRRGTSRSAFRRAGGTRSSVRTDPAKRRSSTSSPPSSSLTPIASLSTAPMSEV